jgi:L-threonylcarbamoyladenylate synthase
MATVLQGQPNEIRLLAEWLRADGVVAVPTETVYGLAGNACSAKACRGIFEAKGRPFWDPLIVHVASVEHAKRLVVWDERAQQLADAFWPGPLTMILPSRGVVASEVSAGKDTVGVRMPNHPLFLQLLHESQLALAAPSANPFGYLSPTRAKDVQQILGDRIDYILDGGECAVGVESTIVDLSSVEPVILRPGLIGEGLLQNVLHTSVLRGWELAGNADKNRAPGLAEWHYSPMKPLRLWDSTKEQMPSQKEGQWVLFTHTPEGGAGRGTSLFGGAVADIGEVARNLYHALLEADSNPLCHSIIVEIPIGDCPLCEALLQRLKKAAARH